MKKSGVLAGVIKLAKIHPAKLLQGQPRPAKPCPNPSRGLTLFPLLPEMPAYPIFPCRVPDVDPYRNYPIGTLSAMGVVS